MINLLITNTRVQEKQRFKARKLLVWYSYRYYSEEKDV